MTDGTLVSEILGAVVAVSVFVAIIWLLIKDGPPDDSI